MEMLDTTIDFKSWLRGLTWLFQKIFCYKCQLFCEEINSVRKDPEGLGRRERRPLGPEAKSIWLKGSVVGELVGRAPSCTYTLEFALQLKNVSENRYHCSLKGPGTLYAVRLNRPADFQALSAKDSGDFVPTKYGSKFVLYEPTP